MYENKAKSKRYFLVLKILISVKYLHFSDFQIFSNIEINDFVTKTQWKVAYPKNYILTKPNFKNLRSDS